MDSIIETLRIGLPVLALQLAVTLALLGIGVGCYMAVTPFHEMRLVRAGNTAGGIVLMGSVVALAIPLAATLATSLVTLDILVWGVATVVLQLLAFRVVDLLLTGLPQRIREGEVAAAVLLVGAKLSTAVILAAALTG